jgi:hypothetical protein
VTTVRDAHRADRQGIQTFSCARADVQFELDVQRAIRVGGFKVPNGTSTLIVDADSQIAAIARFEPADLLGARAHFQRWGAVVLHLQGGTLPCGCRPADALANAVARRCRESGGSLLWCKIDVQNIRSQRSASRNGFQELTAQRTVELTVWAKRLDDSSLDLSECRTPH